MNTHSTRLSLAIAVLAALALGILGCEPRRAAGKAVGPPPIPRIVRQTGVPGGLMVLRPSDVPGMTVATVREVPLPGILEANGLVTFDQRRVSSITSRVSGRIEQVRVSQWDYVHKGELIVALYSPDFMTAEAEYLQAKLSARSMSQAGSSGIGSGDIAQALITAARRKLELLGMSRADIAALKSPSPTVWIRAPISGTVVENKAVRGAAVSPGDELYALGTLNDVWITASIYEDDLARVHPGQALSAVTTAFPNDVFKGTIARISPDIDPTTHTAQVRCEVDNPGGKLKPQMLARVRIVTRPGAALVVPQAALVFETNHYYAFVLTGNDLVERRQVALESWNEQGYARIASGLKAGERVINSESILVNALWHQAHGQSS